MYTRSTPWIRYFLPPLLEMVKKIPKGNTFTSAKLRKAFEEQGRTPNHGFWGFAISTLQRQGVIRKTKEFSWSTIPASRGRRLPVWEKL